MGSAVGSALRAASDRLSSSRRLAGDRDRSLHTAPTEHSETQKRRGMNSRSKSEPQAVELQAEAQSDQRSWPHLDRERDRCRLGLRDLERRLPSPPRPRSPTNREDSPRSRPSATSSF